MPKKGERARKLAALSRGKGVRPPKKWFNLMHKHMIKEYPERSMKAHQKIVGGIWSKMSTSNKKKIVKKYQR